MDDSKVIYLGEIIPEDKIKRYTPDFSDEDYDLVDVEIEGACHACDGSGLCVCDECGHEHECGKCLGTGKEAHADAVYIQSQYLLDMTTRVKTEQLITERFGQMTTDLSQWWTK